MGIVLDYTFRIDPAALKAAGAIGVCRYLKPDSAPTYRIGLAEYRELVGAGIAVTLNWEYDALDWTHGGTTGAAHGFEAVRQAKALGYPAGNVIVGSADFNMTRTQWDGSCHGYAQAFAAAVRGGGYRPGVYGPWDVLTWVRDAGYMDAFWQAGMSTSWSGGRNAWPWPGAHLRQRGHKTVAGQDTDWNEILIPNWGDDMALSDIVHGTKTANVSGDRNLETTIADMYITLRANLEGEHDPRPGTPMAGLIALAKGAPQLLAATAADEQRDNAALAAITALTTLVQQGGGNVDSAGIIAAVHAVGDDTHAQVLALHEQVADLQQQLAAVQARNVKLAEALAAAGGALDAADD